MHKIVMKNNNIKEKKNTKNENVILRKCFK